MEIRQSNISNEKGLFATKKYFKDDIVHVLTGEIFDKPTRETIHIGNNKHIYDDYGIFINHSFNPNIYVCKDKFIALCDININDELFFNYNETETTMAEPFYVDGNIVCGNVDCNEQIFNNAPDFGKKITFNLLHNCVEQIVILPPVPDEYK